MAKIPLEQISIGISFAEKQELQQLADEKNLSVSAMARRAIQAYLFALRTRKKKVQLHNVSVEKARNE